MSELGAVFLVMAAEQVVDDLFLGNVICGSDIEGLDEPNQTSPNPRPVGRAFGFVRFFIDPN